MITKRIAYKLHQPWSVLPALLQRALLVCLFYLPFEIAVRELEVAGRCPRPAAPW
jgi:hypothetical protein